MHDTINLRGYRSILCLNGDLPDLTFFTSLKVPIIAADGAANSLVERGISPTLIIGDLDSVRHEIFEHHSFLRVPEQESNDYQKAMRYLKDNELLPAIVVGINGGHLDHILNNINIFIGTNCLLYAPPLKGFVINQQSKVNLLLPIQTKISLMGIPKATLSSKGLKWELNHAQLSFPGQTSCFNRTLLSEITLEVHRGAVLVLIYEQRITDAGSLSNN